MHAAISMNKQMQKAVDKGDALPLMEAFYTIQGEGYHKGSSAFFIRIGGCDVGCHWCDVKESWNADLHPPTYVDKIVEKVKKYSNIVVVTGGEPLMWNMTPLTNKLKNEGIKIHIETSGAYPLTGTWDWICLSPKKTMPPKNNIYEKADELKVIIHNNQDIRFAEEQKMYVGKHSKLYLQPEWSKRESTMPIIVSHVLNNPEWLVSLQTHKYLNIP